MYYKRKEGRRTNDVFVCATAFVRQEDTLEYLLLRDVFLCVEFVLSIYFCYVLNYDIFCT